MTYSYRTQGGRSGFGGGFSPTALTLVKLLGGIYIAELILLHWLNFQGITRLFLYPIGPEFAIWQPFTHFFLQYPSSPFPFLFQLLFLWFFSGILENTLGKNRFLTLFFLCGFLGGMIGSACTMIPGFQVVFVGLAAATSGLFAAFCLLYPHQQILLFFILPVQAWHIFLVFLAIDGLSFLAKSNPSAPYHLAGTLVAYLYIYGWFNFRWLQWLNPKNIVDRIRLARLNKRKSKLKVVSGDSDRPIFH